MGNTKVTQDRTRITWVDYARGVGILLVVVGHTLRGLRPSGIIQDGSVFLAIDSWIYAFHMPLFFFLSGLFAARRVGRSAGKFLRDIFGSIAYPYLVWSVLQILMQFALSRYTNNRANFTELVGILVFPVMQFWFLYALFLIYLGYYVLHRIGLGPVGVAGLFGAFWLTQGYVELGGWWPINATRIYGIYFALGLLLTRYGWTEWVGHLHAAALASVVALGYGAVACAVIYLPGTGASLNSISALAVALCGGAASVALAVLLSRMRGLDLFRVMGVCSLEIYVAHTIASAGVRIILVRVLSIESTSAHVVIGTAAGIALPILLSRLCGRFHAEFLFRLRAP
jgi:fucose 4-O-acetylase-like acetyltransferase